jgi:5-methylcytosine-specific restriction enzyme subunit McrC
MSHRASSLLDLFIALFADRLLSEARHGLPRQYCEKEDDLQSLRGRLNVMRQFTVHAVRPDRLACRFDELDGDTPLMRIMKACVVLVTRYARSFDTQRKLAELRFLLTDVADVAPTALPWEKVRIDRTSRRWQSLFGLAQLLLRGSWQETHAGRRQPEGVTLLFQMNDLFERYIAIQMRQALSPLGLDVVAQGGFEYCLGDWAPGEPCAGTVFRTRPDIIVRRVGHVEAIIDTKWKKLSADPLDPRHGVSQSDVYQLTAYARLYRCDRVVLLYPASHGGVRCGIVRTFGISRGHERLEIADVDVSAGGEVARQCLRGMFDTHTEP